MGFEVSERVLEMLDWGVLEAALAEETVSPGGRRLALARDWAGDSEIEERLDEVTEARALLADGRNPFHGTAHEILPQLAQAAKGKVLGGLELLRIGEALRAMRMTQRALRECGASAPRLAAHGETLPDLSGLEQTLLQAIDGSGRLRDEASPALAEARREALQLTAKIQKKITAALSSPAFTPHLQDRFYTLRAERYVLPIKIESRGRIRGIVHDVSASGTTVFVEPEEIVDLNNRLRYAELAEERESIRILVALAGSVGERILDIEASTAVMSRIDRIIAGARLAKRLLASRPQVVSRPLLSLRLARHPLLALRAQPVVPNDLEIGETCDGLILSGPNAGGKTVTLKAAGLAVLMVRAGLHIPAEEGSRVGLFSRLHADIGDDQSLADSLSTFSGQIAQMIRFLEASDEGALILLDEMIVGTDPTEGAVLAQAVLEALVARGARVMVTTHYPLLKELAAHDPRFENASMGYDPETHRLTYRIIPGVPGRSGALEIAANLGLEGAVLERARALLGSDRLEMEDRLRQLDALRLALEAERREAERVRSKTEDARQRWVEKLREIEQARLRISQDVKAALDAEVSRAQEEIASVIRDLQRKGTAQEAGAARRRIIGIEDRLKEKIPAPPQPAVKTDWSRVLPGAALRLVRLGAAAEFMEGPNAEGRIKVRVGGKRMLIDATDAQPALEAAPARAPARPPVDPLTTSRGEDAPRTSRNTLDVRGLRVDEAEAKVVYFLDKLYGAGESTAYLIHGHGTGALKSALRAYLSESPYVAAFRAADAHDGGDGVTIISLST